MKHHKYYKEKIASFLTNFELNPKSITQRWLENKFYSLDDEKMHISRQRIHRESARFVLPSNNNEQNKNTQESKIRCKYCYRVGHTDTTCRDKQDKRPPSMPQWAKFSTCMKCKKKGDRKSTRLNSSHP